MTPPFDDEQEPRHRPDADHVRSQLRHSAADAASSSPEPAAAGSGTGAATNGTPESAADEAAATDEVEQSGEPEQAPDSNGEGEGEAVDALTVALRERDEYLALAKRAQADFENYRKRATKEMAAAGGRARVGLIREILPVVDNLERGLAAASDADGGLVEGVKLVLSDLRGVLARAGVEAIEPTGVQFDPTVHEALTTREQEGADAGTVLDVVEKGYRTDDVVVRPARVIVAA